MLVVVTIASLLFALVCLVYAFFAMIQDFKVGLEVKKALEEASKTAKAAGEANLKDGGSTALAESISPQSALGGVSEWLKALGEFSDGLSKLRHGVAALVVGLAFATLGFAAAGVDDKVADPEEQEESEANID